MNISKDTIIANGGTGSLAGTDFAKLSPMAKAEYNKKNGLAVAKTIRGNSLPKAAGVTSVANKIVNRNELSKKLFGKKTIARVDKKFMEDTKRGLANKKYGYEK